MVQRRRYVKWGRLHRPSGVGSADAGTGHAAPLDLPAAVPILPPFAGATLTAKVPCVWRFVFSLGND
jgi:hypothetical protein